MKETLLLPIAVLILAGCVHPTAPCSKPDVELRPEESGPTRMTFKDYRELAPLLPPSLSPDHGKYVVFEPVSAALYDAYTHATERGDAALAIEAFPTTLEPGEACTLAVRLIGAAHVPENTAYQVTLIIPKELVLHDPSDAEFLLSCRQPEKQVQVRSLVRTQVRIKARVRRRHFPEHGVGR